jgi:hypothetical protein
MDLLSRDAALSHLANAACHACTWREKTEKRKIGVATATTI